MTKPADIEPRYDFSGLGFQAGECAVVTGAASGIGHSVAGILARSGVSVLGWDINEAGLADLATDLAAEKGTVTTRRVDISDEAEIEAAWAATKGIEVQYLVNNAGPPSMTEMSVAQGVKDAIGGYAAMTDAYLAGHAGEASSVVFTASIAGNLSVSATPDWYPAAKAGIVGYTRHLAVKLRGRPRANAVAPGLTVTARTAEIYSQPSIQERLAKYPMGRAGQAWEVATAICFLLSPAASLINGALIPVEGASTWSSNA
jgi:NAD(P)-dependent dehydrogenase (short-subunit alcohol dehydrogenase family)